MVRHIIISCICIAICLQVRVFAAGNQKHAVPTFFQRRNDDGSLVDRSSLDFDDPTKNHTLISNQRKNTVKIEPIKLITWPKTVEDGGTLTILWSGVTDPQPLDWISYYCPFYDSENHYLDFFYIKDVKGHEKDHEGGHPGYGHAHHIVYNMRKPCVFKYWRQVFTDVEKKKWHYVKASTSNLVEFANGGEFAPTQGHISITNDPTEMRVMWVSGEVEETPVVRYGKTKDLEMKVTDHITHTYNKDDLCEGGANGATFWHPGMTYDVLLKNLELNTTYYFSFGTEKYMSKISHFTTAIPKGDKTPFKYIVYGDMGVSSYPRARSTARLLEREIREHKVQYVFHIGDVSYARGYAYIWDQWGSLIQPSATRIPYMVGIGNHEYEYRTGGLGRDPSKIKTDHGWKPDWFNGWKDSNGECAVPMHKRYHMPANGNLLFWYSYDYGMVHMIMMSTEHDYSPNSTQYKWIENDLKNIDREKTPWVFIGGHRPMYNSQMFPSDYVVATKMQELFEDLLYNYKVDIAFWAHYHSYERTCKLYKNKCVNDGVVHITVGNAGMGVNLQGWYKKDWSLVRIMDYGYGRVTVANSSALFFELIINRHDTVEDKLWLYK